MNNMYWNVSILCGKLVLRGLWDAVEASSSPSIRNSIEKSTSALLRVRATSLVFNPIERTICLTRWK